MRKKHLLQPGKSYPLGATVYPEGVNFSVFSKDSEVVELLLFDKEDHSSPSHTFFLDPKVNKTYFYWHAFIPGLKEGQLYAYRVHAVKTPSKRTLFNQAKVLLDPYAKAVEMDTYDRNKAIHPGDNCAHAIKGVVVDPSTYDWENDRPLNHPFAKSFIYELHVGGFTRHPNSGLPDHLRGTYRGLIKKIPYLKKLGITAVELLPVQQFDQQDAPVGLVNYWGYSPLALFAPHHAYCTCDDPLAVITEFRDMVKALHKAGIEIILDVVFNHTAEGAENGPTISFKGFDRSTYYMLEENNNHYKDYSGAGNTINANHPVVRKMILDCLRYWVSEMHVDGFRFDLAAVLSRDPAGERLAYPPVLMEIETDPILAPAKIIAEAWDISSYTVGSYAGFKWAEWNDRFRNDTRRFLKSDQGTVRSFAHRINGSYDLFNGHPERDPNRSINFVTCHDGFTLQDLVSYEKKHNENNRVGNLDGADQNFSWNGGVEGPTQNQEINQLRRQQIKNFFCVLLLSQGTPMILMGDEVGRTQGGNNNAFCQDNETSWFDWSLVDKNQHLLTFVRHLIQFSLETEYFNELKYWSENATDAGSTITWHGVKPGRPDWSDHSHSIAFTIQNKKYPFDIFIMINAYWQPLVFELPPLRKKAEASWRLVLDTSADSPKDIFLLKKAPLIEAPKYTVNARSIVVLISFL